MVLLRNIPSHIKERRDEILNNHFQTTINLTEDYKRTPTSKYEELMSANTEKESRIVNPNEDQASIDTLQYEIKRHEELLKEVKLEMNKLKIDESNFCPDCIIYIGTMYGKKTTCRDRVDFIMMSHGVEYKDAREALMKERHKCVVVQ